MTIRAKIESGRIVDIPEITPLIVDPLIPDIESKLVSIDKNNAKVEHYRSEGERDILCGRTPILHQEAITEAGFKVVVASGSAGIVEGIVIWQKDSVTDIIRERIGAIRREISSISHS